MAGILDKGEIHRATTDDLVFREHRVQLYCVGDSYRSIYLAGASPPGRAEALQPLLILHTFRFVGLAVLVPGVVSPDLPPAFAHSAAYADLIVAILALLSLLLLRSAPGVSVVWIFNLWGTADLLNSFYQGPPTGLLAGQLGAAYFIPTLLVPLLLITHGLVFRILLKRQPASAMNESRQLA